MLQKNRLSRRDMLAVFLLLAVSAFGCTNVPDDEILAPNFSHVSGTWTFHLNAMAAGNTECGSTYITTYSVWIKYHGNVPLEQRLYSWPSCWTFAGGYVNGSITIDGESGDMEPLIADLVSNFHLVASQLPGDASISLTAEPNQNHPTDECEFLGWREWGQPIFSTSTTIVITHSDPHWVIAEFECGDGGGPM